MDLKLCIYLLFCIYYHVSASGDPCETRDSCTKCITYPKCVWCAKADFGKKCITDNSDIRSQCEGYLQVKESVVEVTEYKPFTSSVEKVVQLTPQRIKIDLRVGQPTSFEFTYKQAENYPVDLYFLLDASFSMKRVRDALKTQSKKIYEVMHKFTTNIRLGLGTFVDKNAFPYVEDPGKHVYSFRHHLNLTENVTDFDSALSKITFVENFDSPEGGLDALAQVLACSDDSHNIIQWNKHSRKFVLFITDDQFHAAGDGLLAGIHQPYDGKCYTGTNGIYTKELEMDYPSVSIIYKLAKRIEAILIFIIKDDKASIYYDLSDYLGGILKTYKQVSTDSTTDNFDDKLREAYEDKTKFVKLKTTIPGMINQDNLIIDFTPDCSEANFEPLDACEIHESKEIKITGTITLEIYNKASDKFTVDIVVNGINEKLQLDINVLNNCDCEKEGTKNAPECSGNGTLVCGLCECNENWYGSKCKCNKPDDSTDLSSCKMNKDDDKVCSGNGKCECGACKCDSHGGEQTYSGTYCQCNANSCPIGSNGKQCSGNGACGCGRCMCDNTWKGIACETSTLKTNCLKDNKECYGLGTCVNNTCECYKVPEWDARQTFDKLCAIIPETDQNQCKLLENHARCAYDKKRSCPNEDSVNVSLTKVITESENKSMKICDDVRVGPGCYIHFGYKYNDGVRTVQLLVEEKANCQESHYMFGGIVLVTLIVVGICTLAGWKILTTIRDRKEYEQFLLSSNRQASIRKNVLYTSPKTTIDNPTYENRCE